MSILRSVIPVHNISSSMHNYWQFAPKDVRHTAIHTQRIDFLTNGSLYVTTVCNTVIRYALHYDIQCIILACIILLRIIWECIISICIHKHMDLIGTGKNRDKNGILSRDRMQNRCDELITSKVTKKNASTKEDINSIGNRITSIHSSNSFKSASKY